eukprot:TRINITY_DN11437_c0_g2_i14.p1 TRINITY_DN11437_c0_g2~~TRINITY_DN11437_c0_g2_i14.p1  ORF type:complete len:219 (+),score=30.63 TRINITY_DN11437_c0_g2_i14:65-721(+)
MGTDEPCALPDPRWYVVDHISETELYQDNKIDPTVIPTSRNYTIYAYKELPWRCEDQIPRLEMLLVTHAQNTIVRFSLAIFLVCFLVLLFYLIKYISLVCLVSFFAGLMDIFNYGVLLTLLMLQVCVGLLTLSIQATSTKLLDTTCSDPITNRILQNSATTFLSMHSYWIINLIVLTLLTRSALHMMYTLWRAPTTVKDFKASLFEASTEPVFFSRDD